MLLCLQYFPEGSEHHDHCDSIDFILESNDCYIPVLPKQPTFILLACGASTESNSYGVEMDNEVILTEGQPLKTNTDSCMIDASIPVDTMWPPTPYFGGLVDSIPMVCDDSFEVCYDVIEGKQVARLPKNRNMPTATVITTPDGREVLWLTGGYRNDRKKETGIKLESTMYISPTESNSPGPNLPIIGSWSLVLHCMTTINSSTAMVIGGRDTRRVLFFNSIQEQLTEGPKLESLRSDRACGLSITSGGRNLIIAAGGRDTYENDTVPGGGFTTEILDLDLDGNLRSWNFGPDMPIASFGASGVTTNDGRFLYIGGVVRLSEEKYETQKTIYELSCPFYFDDRIGKNRYSLDCHWILHNQELKIARSEFVAMVVPESFYTC